MLIQSSGEDECTGKTKKQLSKITKQMKKLPKKKNFLQEKITRFDNTRFRNINLPHCQQYSVHCKEKLTEMCDQTTLRELEHSSAFSSISF